MIRTLPTRITLDVPERGVLGLFQVNPVKTPPPLGFGVRLKPDLR